MHTGARELTAAAAAVILVFGWLLTVSGPQRGRATGGSVPVEAGVSRALAAARSSVLRSLRYDLELDIPPDVDGPVLGRVTVTFETDRLPPTLVLDFAQPASSVRAVTLAGQAVTYAVSDGHLVIPTAPDPSARSLSVTFVAGDDSLNRNPDYLYSLFVPSRAHLAFPCFDQPDLKARFTLTLRLPAAWASVANGRERSRVVSGDRATVRFEETAPLPTYLFAFVAGRFSVEETERRGRTFRMFHREDDPDRLRRNRDALFDLHADALDWMERYTGVPYPFGKFDFVLIPAFQFSGMEHAGAVLYNASSLLLEEAATQNQQLGRASTIAHETAHMWFGDLVTMRWFDDVWMKEVFANFFAAKIVNPAFPDVNHDLRFLMAHQPAAYAIDRTAGTHPIRQPLDNLRDAAQLYGPIIYQKAPIVMQQLERLVGEEAFRDGLRLYLDRFAFGNATWTDLVTVLDEATPRDVAAWSQVWIDEPGRPTVRTEVTSGRGDRLAEVVLYQQDPAGRGRRWAQQIRLALDYPAGPEVITVDLDAASTPVPDAAGRARPRFVLPTWGGLGYGRFEFDPASRQAVLTVLPDVEDELTRGSAWVTLWDELLEDRVEPSALFGLGLRLLPVETNELNVQQILGTLTTIYRRFLSDEAQRALAQPFETRLRQELARASSPSLKAAYFRTIRAVARTPETVAWLTDVWRRDAPVVGLPLAETDESALALQLAVREVDGWAAILDEQLGRIENADRRERFVFLRPALSSDAATRDAFFDSLADAGNRRHERWVLDALAYLHHPRRAAQSRRYIEPSLALLPDVQRTGDIFFAARWVDATLGGHRSAEAAAIVRGFLDARPDFPPRLRRLVLQSADELFRAARLSE